MFRFLLLTGITLTAIAALGSPASARPWNGGKLNDMDRQFIHTLGKANSDEIGLSQIAARHAHSPAVLHFAEHMISDHGALGKQFGAVSYAVGDPAPVGMDASHRDVARHLRDLSGDSFDSAYMNAMVADHTAAVDLFQREIDHGRNSQVRNFAIKNVGTVQNHLQMAGDIIGHKNVANRIHNPATNKM